MAELRKEVKDTRYERLYRMIKEFEFNPPTGYGEVVIHLDVIKERISLVEVTTKNKPEEK